MLKADLLNNNRKSYFCALIIFVIYFISMFALVTSNNASGTVENNLLLPVQNSYSTFLIDNGKQIGYVNGNTTIFVSIVLKYRNSNNLSTLLSNLYNPKSTLYHRYLTVQQFDANFSPSLQIYNRLIQYLESNGITIQHTWKDRVSISILAKASTIEKVFHTEIGLFVTNTTGLRHVFYAPVKQFSLPAFFLPYIKGIDGATNAYLYTNYISSVHKIGDIYPPNGNSYTGQNITGSDIQKAYGLLQLYNNSPQASPTTKHIFANGKTIATILWEGADINGNEVAPFNPNDVKQYFLSTLPQWELKAGGMPHIWGMGDTGTVGPGYSAINDTTLASVENTLDLEMAGSLAPGASVVNIYGPDTQQGFPDNEFNMAITLKNLTAITNSWGAVPETVDSTMNSDIEQLNARGITVFAASGDNPATPFPSWPADVSFNNYGIVSVGGLTIQFNGVPNMDGTSISAINPIASQSVWYQMTSYGAAGTEAGISTTYTIPSWQNIPAVLDNGGSSTYRNVCDLSAIGNNTLIFYGGSFENASGTSISSPVTAGIVAEISAYLGVFMGNNTGLGFLNPLLYQIGPNNTKYMSRPFYDVTEAPAGYPYPALPGWDFGSGWGSINAWNFTSAIKYELKVYPGYHIVTLPKGSKNITINYRIYLSYPTLYNSSIKLNILSIPAGVAISSLSGPFVLNPLPGNVSLFTNLYLNVSSSARVGIHNISIMATNYNKISKTYGNLSVLTNITLIITDNSTYTVTFNQKGVPSGVTWTVLFNKISNVSTTEFMNFDAVNGSYSYSIIISYNGTGAKYIPATSSGAVTVDGHNIEINVSFRVQYYLNINIDPWNGGTVSPGSFWYNASTVVEISAMANNISIFEEWLGTGTGSYTGKSSTVNITMNGPVTEIAVFRIVLYPVSFIENGIPSSASWNVTLNGLSKSSFNNTISFEEPNGTYLYRISTGVKGYLPDPSSGYVTVNGNPNTVSATIITRGVTNSIIDAYDPVNHNLYMSQWDGTNITAINTTTNSIRNISLAYGTYNMAPSYIIYNPTNQYLYIYGFLNNSNGIYVLNPQTNKIVEAISVPGLYSGDEAMVLDPANGNIYVVGANNNSLLYYPVFVLYALTPTYQLINVTQLPSGVNGIARCLTYDSANKLLYISQSHVNDITVVDPQKKEIVKVISLAPASEINAGPHPENLIYDSANHDLYVTDDFVNDVTVISSNNTIVSNITVGTYPSGIAYDNSTNYLYVTNYGSDSVSVINAYNEVSNTIKVGNSPWGAVYDPSNNNIYVTNYWANPGTVSIISGETTIRVTFVHESSFYNILFSEKGLPKGDWWNVSLNGTVYSSDRSTILFGGSNGTYSFSVKNTSDYYAMPSSGIVTVKGKNVLVNITFFLSKQYNVTFTESGLNKGTTWAIGLGNVTKYSNKTYIVFSLVNGTYNFTVKNVTGYRTNISTIKVIVNGKNVSVNIFFTSRSIPTSTSTSTNYNSIYESIIIIVSIIIVIELIFLFRNEKRNKKRKKKEVNKTTITHKTGWYRSLISEKNKKSP